MTHAWAVRGGADRGGGPLVGRRIAVTRPEASAGELAELLSREGAVPILLPLIRTEPAGDAAPLQAAAARAAGYDWIAFTSGNAVRALAEVLPAGGIPRHVRIAAIGSATAEVIQAELGRQVDAMPPEFTGRALVAAMTAAAPVRGARVLWPRARDARDDLPSKLRAAGARLDDPEAYRTAPVPGSARELHRLIERGEISAITLTAPSAVRALATAGTDTGAAVVAVIGTSTDEAARAAGLTVHVRAAEHTIPALVHALALYPWRR
ncbi:MAG: uroporphyrinogen-III synthase [Gemmatimonadota bacterium]